MLDELDERYIRYNVPFNFSCKINGKWINASILGYFDLEFQFAYLLLFGNGYKVSFTRKESGTWESEKIGSKPYAEAIQLELDKLLDL